MKIRVLFLAATLIAIHANAETPGEKRWRLRAEILERELELAHMELAERSSPSQVSTAPTAHTAPEPLVDDNGMQLPSAEAKEVSIASMAPLTLEEPNEGSGRRKSKRKDPKEKEKGAGETPEEKEPPEKGSIEEYIQELRKWRKVDKEEKPPLGGDIILSYQMLKPSTRVFFDSGNEDADEPDLFKDGNFGASVELLALRADYYLSESISIGGFLGGGLAAATENTFNAAVVAWNIGIALSFEELPVGLEFGFMQGISASDQFDDHFDSALFVGLTTHPSVGSHRVRVNSKHYKRPKSPRQREEEERKQHANPFSG